MRATTRTFDGRIYVFLLDDLHTAFTRTQAVRDAAKRFIQQYLGANDLAAVVYTSGRQESGQELTSSPRLLKAAIDRFQGQKLPSAGAEKLAIHIRQTDTDAVLADEPQQTHNREALEKAESIKDPYDAERGLNARRALQAVENVANWMRDVQGRRKALLLFSEGLDYDIYQPFDLTQSASAIVAEARQAAAAAQRANVNVYGIDPRGLSQFGELIDISARSDYPAARVRHVPRSAARAPALAGEPDFLVRGDWWIWPSSMRAMSSAASAGWCSTTAGTTSSGTTAIRRSGRASS